MYTDRDASTIDVLPRVRRRRERPDWRELAVIAGGGVVGSLARYGVSVALPPSARGLPWATFVVNVAGCLLIGALMILIVEVWSPHRLLRPFLGIGLFGGFTTFSTYTVDTQRLLVAGAPRLAFAYLAGTLVAALAATALGVTVARLLTRAGHVKKGSPR